MKVLITGATGFLGSHLCRRMVAEGFEIRILCRPTSSLESIGRLPDKIIGDVTDPESLKRAVVGCDYVIHAAAVSGFRDHDQNWQMRVNVDGTRHIAQAARVAGVARLLHISSVAAIGTPTGPERPADEGFRFNLTNSGWTYHISKERAEAAVLEETACGLNAVIVNPSVICGPAADGYRVAEPIKQALAKRIVPYTAGGLCLVHIDDVIQGIMLALRKGVKGNRYILGGNNVSFEAMAKASVQEFGLRRFFVPVPSALADFKGKVKNCLRRSFGARRMPEYERRACFQFYDSSKAIAEFGYRPRNLAAILKEFAAYRRAEILRTASFNVGHPDQRHLKDASRDAGIHI